MPINLCKYLVLILVVTAMTGCGFHLRGKVQIPQVLLPLTVQELGTTKIKVQLKQLLNENSVSYVENINAAATAVVIQNEQFKRRVLSVGGSGKVQEFALQYLVSFSFVNQQQELLLARQEIRLERDLRFDESAVLSMSQEESRTNQAMVEVAARQILRRLQSLSPDTIASKGPAS